MTPIRQSTKNNEEESVIRDELRKKFKKLPAVLPSDRIEKIIDAVERIDRVDDAASLVRFWFGSPRS